MKVIKIFNVFLHVQNHAVFLMKGKLLKNQICFTPYAFQEVATSKEKHTFMLSFETGFSPYPLLARIGKTSTCNTERRKKKREEKT